jgi:two-component system response regulator HydG
VSRRVLIVDDDKTMCEFLVEGLAGRGFEPTFRTSADEALTLLAAQDFDAIVTDLNMPGLKGTEFCARCALNRPDTPVLVVTGFGSLETAVAAIRAGAYDYLTKPFEIEALGLALERATKHRALREEVKSLRRAVAESTRWDEVIGASLAMKRVHDLLERIADSDTTVLVTGETGTGKEVVARALHARSRRKTAPFVPINCGAIPESLLESELFGHVKGAFTDARSARPGLFVQAKGGTVFLDEIGDMPREMQVKLLRALQERKARPVGGDQEVDLDVRVIAATNRDLEDAVHEGRFREDLFYRLNVINLALPPLRARGNDVLLLAQHFLEHFATRADKKVTGLSSGAAEKLLAYAWPGNVRELQNCMERAVALTRFEQLTVDDLPEKIRDHRRSHVLVTSDDPSELVPMEEVERRYVLRVLESTGGNKSVAAQILGFDRKTLYRKLERYGEPPAPR